MEELYQSFGEPTDLVEEFNKLTQEVSVVEYKEHLENF